MGPPKSAHHPEGWETLALDHPEGWDRRALDHPEGWDRRNESERNGSGNQSTDKERAHPSKRRALVHWLKRKPNCETDFALQAGPGAWG